MAAFRLRPATAFGLTLALALLAAPAARADMVYSGTIQGSFSNPILAGNVINLAGVPTFQDNTGTAAYSIVNNGSVASIISGDNNGGSGSPSIITFTGSAFSGVTPGQLFQMGTLTFNNGTSTLTSVIFGGTLTFGVVGSPGITVATTDFSLVTTANGGFSAVQDADYLGFPAPVSINFNVYENSGATAIVMGRIVGDPVLEFTGLDLDPNEENGFLSEPNPVPAPAGVVLLGSGAVCLIGRRLRKGC